MDISERLSNLRDAVAGCHVSAFIDLSSKMVLSVDARSKQPQERLDSLAERADRLFNTPGLGSGDGVQTNCVVTPLPDNTEIFIRAPDTPEEVLGLVCSTDADIRLALEQCDMMLAMLSEAR